MKLYKSIFVLLCLVLASCSPSLLTSTATDSSSLPLPDLVVSSIGLTILDVNGECLGGYQIQVTITNQGDGTANQIIAVETSTGQTISIESLGAGEKFTFNIPAAAPTGMYLVNVDPENTIPELNETNNNLSFLSPTPTPPLECIRTPVGTLDLSTAPTFPSVQSLAREILVNSSYRSQDWGEFQLMDGVFERTSSVGSSDTFTTHFQDPIIYGDLNSDGAEDALVILNTQNGGTGHFIELAAVLNQNGSPFNVSTLYLGDRVIVESGSIQEGLVTLNMVVHGPNDGLCCPSQSITRTFRLQDNQLVQLP